MIRELRAIIEEKLHIRIYRGWYPRGHNVTFDLKRLLTNAETIVDIGANVGQTASHLSSIFPQAVVHACEPSPHTFLLLKRNTAKLPMVRTHQIAMGDRNADVVLHIYDGSVNHSIKQLDHPKSQGSEMVQVQTLASFVNQQHLDVIDYVKIDTEGYDLKVARGGAALLGEGRIKVVLAELGFSIENERHVPFHEFHSFMECHSMRLFGIYNQSREFGGLPVLRRADCLYISTQHEYSGLTDSPDQ